MQKWNVPPDRAQKVDEKMGEFVYSSCLLRELWSLKFQKWLIFCNFHWCQQKISHNLEKLFTCIWKISFSSFRKCYGFVGFWATISKLSTLEDSFIIFLLTQQFFGIYTLDISRMVTPRPIKHTIIWKNSKISFRCT